MQYDFDRVHDRRGTGSSKWDNLQTVFGTTDILPMWVADMDFQSPLPVIEALKKKAEQGFYGYNVRPASFFEAIIEWIQKRHGWEIKRDWITFSSGVVQGLNFCVMSYTHPGDKIIVQSPVYFPFFNVIRNNGRQIVDNPQKIENGRYVMDFDDLRKKFDSRTKMMILCSPNNPTGEVWPKEDLKRLGEICLENGVVVVADEIHSDLIYKGVKHTPMATISEELAQNTVTFYAPSKTFNMPGLASSVAVIPNPRLRALYANTLQNVGGAGGNAFGIVGLEAAYRHGEEWLEQLLVYLEANMDYLVHYCAEAIPKIKVAKPQATYLAWLDCRELGMSAPELRKFLIEKAKVGMNDGSVFGPAGEGFARMNVACPRSTLEEGLRRLEEAVNGL